MSSDLYIELIYNNNCVLQIVIVFKLSHITFHYMMPQDQSELCLCDSQIDDSWTATPYQQEDCQVTLEVSNVKGNFFMFYLYVINSG